MRSRFLALACAACGWACTGQPHPTYAATFTDRTIRIQSYARSFRNAEPALLQAMESETRVFARVTPKPTLADLERPTHALAPGSGAWINRAFADPFLFADRETELSRVRGSLSAITFPNAAAIDSDLTMLYALDKHDADVTALIQLRFEQGAFQRLLDAEDARLERERTLPRSAADLLRAIALAWPLSPKPGALRDLESLVVWRFENLQQALGPSSISEAERDDIRDALDELAPLLAQLPKANAAIAKLRTSLDQMWVTPYALEDEAAIDKELTVYVGASMAFDALDGAFASAQRAFEGQADAGLSVLDRDARKRVLARAKQLLLAAPACMPRTPIHSPLDLAPPEERAWSCALVHALDDSRADLDELAADVAWRDAIVVARWAVSTHGPLRSVEAAERTASLRLEVTASERARLMVLARARPMRAIAVGVAASILAKTGAARLKSRAARWRALGDAPMDLVDEALDK